MKALLALALALAPLAACASAQATPEPATAQRASTDDPKAVCVATMTRARACTDDYIPALVDARAAADMPAGIADQVKKDRDGVIVQAKEEWKTDSQDANISGMCDKMAADMGNDAEGLATAKDCNAKSDCKAYTSCVMPLFSKHLHKQ